MGKSKSFRPLAIDNLEDRTVPSGFGFGQAGGGFIGLGNDGGFGRFAGLMIASIPAEDVRLVAYAFQAFQQSYRNDVQSILLSSTGTPASNRAAFDTQVTTDLTTLNSSIDTAIANLPDVAALEALIEGELLKPTPSTDSPTTTTLQTELANVKTRVSTNWWATRNFAWQSLSLINQSISQVTQQARTSTPPTGTITSTTTQTLVKAVKTAFQTFTQGYANAVSTTPPSTGRPAFNTAVSTLVTILNQNIQSAVTAAKLPSATTGALSTLTTKLANDLVTPSTNANGAGLQEHLAALTTPAAPTGWSPWVFDFQSFGTIRSTRRQVIYDILSAINAFDVGL